MAYAKGGRGSWHGEHMGRPSSPMWFELMSDPGFAAGHSGDPAGEYLQGYADALEDAGVLSHDGARAFEAAVALGEANRNGIGGRLGRGDVDPLLREARVYEPEEYCVLNGIVPGDDPRAQMVASVLERAAAAEERR